MIRLPTLVFLACVLAAPRAADAFCGFYVAGSDQQLVNDATQVVLMRMGTRTVLAMQNNYKGPPEAFAMVIPVPVVLHEQDVKTLPRAVFQHVEQMGAPRLVEYWEKDPCNPVDEEDKMAAYAPAGDMGIRKKEKADDLGVKIEAKFTVGEYQVLILSAQEATGLETWLHDNKYNVPAGAAPLLRPYVETGMKFFVAKVDPQKVKFEDGRAALSPLRFHYDSDEFSLPIRLGLANSAGTQDLIVNIFAPHQRYQVANYDNVTIPTNLDVKDSVKSRFGAFYAALFDATLEKHHGAVVTEYAWQATTCDPCPGPTINGSELMTLGADVLAGPREQPQRYDSADFVLTRLHARYGKEIKDDLVFKAAGPIVGGREFVQTAGKLEEGARPDSTNNFQARYAIRHAWDGPLRCEHPQRGIWGGPPPQVTMRENFQPMGTRPALDLAYAPRNTVQLAAVVTRDVPEIGLKVGTALAPPEAAAGGSGSARASASDGVRPAAPPTKKASGCGCQTTGGGGVLGGAVVALGALGMRRRRRR